MCIDVYRRMEEKMKHEMQHPDSPTWCIHCGTFDDYCEGGCPAERTGRFDSRRDENFRRMAQELFGNERCHSVFNGPTQYRCQLDEGHGGEHFSECSNPEFTQRWTKESEVQR